MSADLESLKKISAQGTAPPTPTTDTNGTINAKTTTDAAPVQPENGASLPGVSTLLVSMTAAVGALLM